MFGLWVCNGMNKIYATDFTITVKNNELTKLLCTLVKFLFTGIKMR
jgi:hypothetical protein